jgi:PadR family transcriptional regulator PadR
VRAGRVRDLRVQAEGIHRNFPEKGWIKFLILRFIHEAPTFGYQLIQDMELKGYVKPGRFRTGSIYTILNRMEQQGLLSSCQVKSKMGRPRRVYSITIKGTTLLKRGLENIDRRRNIWDKLLNYYNSQFVAKENKN